jgi:hypothetical protein
MPEVYHEAALRHFSDAEHLSTDGRLDSAGHLIGFAAECAVKHAIISLPSGDEAPHLHFPELINVAKRKLKGRQTQSMFTILQSPKFMKDWLVAYRYSANGIVTRDIYDGWRSDASRLLGAAQIRKTK